MLSYGRQTIEDDDIAAVVDALRAPMLTCGPLVDRFEHALGAAVGAEHVTACSSGTAALHLAYAALDLGPGDEIITTPLTFSATAAAAYYCGAAVRVADVDPRTGNLDIASVEPLIGPRTRAIVPVHLAGQPVDLDPIIALARRFGLLVIEDACHALGARYREHRIGAGPSDAVVFSFHPVKHITTGEGGAVVARSADVKRRLDRLRHHGMEKTATSYQIRELGWNYRLPDLNCALGISQLAKLDRFVARRRELAARYRARLARLAPLVECPPELPDRESSYHLFAVAIDFAALGTTRADVQASLARDGVGTQVHYPPLLQHPLHRARCPGELARPRPGSDRYFARTLSLPLFPAMTDGDVDLVVRTLHTTLGVTP